MAFSLAELRDAATLCRLAQDQDSGVRNWAAFGLRRLRVDDRETRQLLLELASDDDSETREEAVCALAELGDTRVVGRIVEELSNPDVSLEVIEASSNLGDVRVLEALRRLKEASGSAGTPELEHAISKIERAIAETDFE